jgi:hypothetical protein
MNYFSPERRKFLKAGILGLGAMTFLPGMKQWQVADEWPVGKKLGRVCVGKVEIKVKPNLESESVGTLYEDGVVEWLREVIGGPNVYYSKNLRWVETPQGFIYAPFLQPVENNPNIPMTSLPTADNGAGMWVETTVPYVNIYLANPPGRAPILEEIPQPRFYYSQVFWVKEITVNSNGISLYRLAERYGSYGDEFWAEASAFRPITEEEVSPISSEVDDKQVSINLGRQTLSCLENGHEVYFCRISSGAKFDSEGNVVEKWSTPVGLYHVVNRKWISVHMAGGSAAAGYELFGVSYTSVFASGGVAMHSTYWHNNYGEPMSHGCVNLTPGDAKWIYRWTLPAVPYNAGVIEQTGYTGTNVKVVEG